MANKNNNKKSGSPVNIADMNIAFDDEGKMMNVVKLNPDKLGEIGKVTKLTSFLNENMT